MGFPKELIIVFLTVFIDTLGISFVAPMLPYLTVELGGSSAEMGMLNSSYCITQLISVYAMGALSDKFGRRFFLILSLFGSTLGPILQGLSPNVLILIIARAFTGLLSGSFTVAQAYIADVISKEERPTVLARLSATSSMAYVFGPAIGGLLSQINLRVPFYAAGGCAGIVLLCALFLLKETNPKLLRKKELKNERKQILKNKISLNDVDKEKLNAIEIELKSFAQKNSKEQTVKVHWNIYMILSVVFRFFNESAVALCVTVYALYFTDEAGATSFQYSLLICATGVVAFVNPAFFLPFLLNKCKMNMYIICGVGSLIMTIGYVAASLAHTIWSIAIWCMITTLGSTISVTLSPTVLSIQAPPEVQGTVLGIGSVVTPIAGVIIPLLTGYTYLLSHQYTVMGGGLCGLIMTILCIILYTIPGGKGSASAPETYEKNEQNKTSPSEKEKEDENGNDTTTLPNTIPEEHTTIIIENTEATSCKDTKTNQVQDIPVITETTLTQNNNTNINISM